MSATPSSIILHATPATMSAYVNMDAVVEAYIASLYNVRDNSKALYRRTLSLYLRWLQSRGYHIGEVEAVHIAEYRDYLLIAGHSVLSVANYLNTVKSFYRYTEAHQLYRNVAKGVKPPTTDKDFRKMPLTPEQAATLLDYFRQRSIRDYAMVGLMLRTGLRTIEVVRATVSDIRHRQNARVLYVHGKGRDDKREYVELTDKAYKPIAEYLTTRGAVRMDEPLFTSTSNNNTGGMLTTRSVSRIAKEGLRAIGLDDDVFTAHSFRHTAVVTCRRAGGTQEQAQGMARHKSPATTQRYDAYFREEQRLTNSAERLIDKLF